MTHNDDKLFCVFTVKFVNSVGDKPPHSCMFSIGMMSFMGHRLRQ